MTKSEHHDGTTTATTESSIVSDSQTVPGDIYICYTDVTMVDNIRFELPDMENDVNETDTFALNNI